VLLDEGWTRSRRRKWTYLQFADLLAAFLLLFQQMTVAHFSVVGALGDDILLNRQVIQCSSGYRQSRTNVAIFLLCGLN
jgi:hypothetical protein